MLEFGGISPGRHHR